MTLERDVIEDESIRRMREILARDRWPSGLWLTTEERRIVAWNLEGALADRDLRRIRQAEPLR